MQVPVFRASSPASTEDPWAEIAKASSQVVSNVRRMGECSKEINALQERRQVLQQGIEESQGNIKALEQRNEVLKTHIQSLDAAKAANDTKIATLDTRTETLDARAAEIAAQKLANEKKRQQLLAMLEQKKKQAATKPPIQTQVK